jgi:hypothetical protein
MFINIGPVTQNEQMEPALLGFNLVTPHILLAIQEYSQILHISLYPFDIEKAESL